MNALLLLARLLLAAVFAVAGVAKLADQPGSRRAVVDFGLPAPLAVPFGLLLPLAELLVAAALFPAALAWWGALGALGLLLLFIAGIAVSLAHGRRPDCHCFGQLHSAPAGPSTLARNTVLGAIAAFIVWQGPGNSGPGLLEWAARVTSTQVALGLLGLGVLLALAVEGWLLVHLLQQNGRLLLRIEALEARFPRGERAAGAHAR